MKDLGNSILGVLAALYFLVSQIMTIIFFIEYCRKDSIVEITFIDSWLSEIKGLLWVFFI